jgi:Ca2+-binding EF-hand superfamily protein
LWRDAAQACSARRRRAKKLVAAATGFSGSRVEPDDSTQDPHSLNESEGIVMKKLTLSALVLGSGLALAGTVLAGTDCHAGKGGGRMSHLDADKDGKVTLAEIVQSKQGWLRDFDANKDGAVTRAEFDARFQARRSEHVNQLLAKQDTNKDGVISREESSMPARWFARIDANSDGKLTRDELSRPPARPGARDGEHGGMFSKLDGNNDGKVDAAETQALAEQMLKRLDKNGDGSLDASELQQRWQGRRGPRGHGDGSKGAAGTQAS